MFCQHPLKEIMSEQKCPICRGRMSSYGDDELICVGCGFVTKKPIFSEK